jgi:hypothetical protein
MLILGLKFNTWGQKYRTVPLQYSTLENLFGLGLIRQVVREWEGG